MAFASRALAASLAAIWLLAALALPSAAQDGGQTPAPVPPGAGQDGGEVPAPVPGPPPISRPTTGSLYYEGQGGRYLLDGTWHHRLDRENLGVALGFARGRSLEGWTPVTIPHAWNAADLSDQSQRGTVGWYRRDFRVPRSARTTTWRLRFESVNYRARVYLNGREIGRHEGAYIPFELPASTLARRRVNRLVVRVDSRHLPSDLPPGRDQTNGRPGGGWWNYGGMLREVYLRRVDRIDIAELLVRPQLRCRSCDASVLLRAVLRNPGGGRRKVRLSAAVGGAFVRFPQVEVPSGGSRQVEATTRIDNPRLWEPGSPELYAVSAAARIGRRTVATYRARIGIRSVRVNRQGRVLLNGRPVTLRGASIHEDDPQLGAALTPAKRVENFQLLEELGATITRAHYPLHPHFLELADRRGVLVWNQIPFYQVRAQELRRRAVRDKGLAYLATTVRRDQNHPSVFTWSIANELSSRVSAGQRLYITGALSLLRRLDPSRLTAIDFAGYPTVQPSEIYRLFDALGVNSYFGWYPGPNGQIVEREELGPYLDQLHEYYPTEALFITEFGAEANRPGPGDEKGTFEFQREFMRFHVSTYDQRPFVNGAIAWILRDFRVRPDWDGGNPKPQPPVNFKGLVDESGGKKPAFRDVARLYRNVDPLR